MLTYRCYGRHGQGKQERTDGREAAASYLLIEEAVCPICKSRITLKWNRGFTGVHTAGYRCMKRTVRCAMRLRRSLYVTVV